MPIEIEYSLEFESLLSRYQSRKYRVRAYAIDKIGLSTYDIANHFKVDQSTVCKYLN